MRRQIDVTVDEPALRIEAGTVQRCLTALDGFEDYSVPKGSMGIAFVSRDACCRLHAEFFGDPDPTDVMTFPGDAEDDHAGDVAICPDVAARQCVGENTSFNEELTLYLVHAWLHLAGLDDRNPAGMAEMRAAESILMQRLRNASSLLAAEWIS